MLILGTTATVFSQSKTAKNSGILSVKTSPASYPVKVNGQVIGMSGVASEALFYLTPGVHVVEVEGPAGQRFLKEINFARGQKHCICLKVLETSSTRPCPYDVYVQGPDRVNEGDTVYFKVINRRPNTVPLNYLWSVTPSALQILSGRGTDTIAIDTTGLGGQNIRASVDVNDGVYDETCKQTAFAPTVVDKVIVEQPTPYRCDIFESRAFDDDKARFDNCVIELQNRPDAQIYLIFYQGTDRASQRTNTVERLQRRTLDYLVRTRGVDPGRIQMVKWGTRAKTTVEIWIVPPGAQPPVPQ
jgi:hypothetical protein